MSYQPSGVVKEFAEAIVAESRQKPEYGDRPVLELAGYYLQCVNVTGGVGFAFWCETSEHALVFADIELAVQAILVSAEQRGVKTLHIKDLPLFFPLRCFPLFPVVVRRGRVGGEAMGRRR